MKVLWANLVKLRRVPVKSDFCIKLYTHFYKNLQQNSPFFSFAPMKIWKFCWFSTTDKMPVQYSQKFSLFQISLPPTCLVNSLGRHWSQVSWGVTGWFSLVFPWWFSVDQYFFVGLMGEKNGFFKIKKVDSFLSVQISN